MCLQNSVCDARARQDRCANMFQQGNATAMTMQPVGLPFLRQAAVVVLKTLRQILIANRCTVHIAHCAARSREPFWIPCKHT